VPSVSTPLRDESPGYHHVVCRGNNKRTICQDDGDRDYFCVWVTHVARKYHWRILAWCLMDNHYHLLIEVTDLGLKDGMCELNSGYARRFNRRHGRVNHLFGKRYWSRRVGRHAEMLNVVRYIVQNPVRAGLPGTLEGQIWCSYAATLGLAVSKIDLARESVLGFFGGTPNHAAEEFRVFCSALPPTAASRWQPP
jgi:putative transposase